MPLPRHTPYDGSSTPFTIGLTAIEGERWIETDDGLERYLDEKDRLLALNPDAVFQEIRDSRPAQQEALDLLVTHLTTDHPASYRKTGETIAFLDRRVPLHDGRAPLLIAGSIVADDLVILENRGGWRVTAGYVAFPTSWSLREKAGLTIGEVHGPVPGFEAGSRNDGLINRMFDKILPDRIVERFNWSVYPAADLDWPPEKGAKVSGRPFEAGSSFVRVERQTLRKLPATGAILFTIRIYQDPIAAVVERPELAQALSARLDAMTPEQLAYKGLKEKAALVRSFLATL